MSSREVAAVAGSVFQLADILQRLGNSFYHASAAWAQFPIEVHLLQAKHESLEVQFERFGQSPLPSVLSALEEAKTLMEAEVMILENRVKRREANDGRNCTCGIMPCFKRLGEMVFPEQVGLAIKTATQALDSIVKHLKEVQENEDVFRIAAVARCDSLPFGNDSKAGYVPLERTESRLLSALTESTTSGPSVVLLHGGPGRGKSTVARQISSILRTDKESFAQVFMLECGVQADVEARQMELLQKFGSGGDDLSAMSGSQSSSQSAGSKSTRQSLLRSFLKKQKLLIVLDDVSETLFLQRFLEISGAGVKYLVTSQQENLCKDLAYKCLTLQIEDLEVDDARRILAVHAGFSDQLIPDHVKDVAEKMLAQADGIPLVLAQLGAQIGKAENDYLEVWESIADNFLECLDATPSKYIFGNRYSKSWWAAMRQSCDSLSQKAKQLLVLSGMCKGPTVPESVLQFLYSAAFPVEGCTKYRFSQIKMELKGRELVFEKGERLLSLHSLTKKFILEEMSNTTESIAGCLYPENSHLQQQKFHSINREERVIMVLICLYLDPEHGQKVALQTGYPLNTFSVLKRATAEPIIQLLVPKTMLGKNFTATDFRTAAIQVLLEFICNDALLPDKISELLQCGTWTIPILKFLQKLYFLGEWFWQTNTLQSISSKLVCILQEDSDPVLLVQARQTLFQLCLCRDQDSDDVISTPEMLHQLVQSLRQVQNSHLQHAAAGALAFLAHGEGMIVSKRKLVNFPQVLDNLVQSLAEDQDSSLQSEAARALVNLTAVSDPSILDRMTTFPNLLHRLAESLTRTDIPLLQEHAASIIANLGWGEDKARKNRIVNFPQLLQRLVQSVTQDQNFKLQKQAARALVNLVGTWDSTILDDLLHTLREWLMTEHNQSRQEQAATVLAEFGGEGDDSLRGKIVDYPMLMEKLVHSLAQDQNFHLQVEAARTLQNLAHTSDNSTLNKMANFPDLLQWLGESLTKDHNPHLQEHAAGAIAFLGWGDDKSRKNNIANLPQLLERLVQSATQDQNFGLQRNAVRALGNLASTWDPTILDSLLHKLGESLVTERNLGFQEQGVNNVEGFSAATNNAFTRESAESLNFKLSEELYSEAQGQSFRVQWEAAKSLSALASTYDNSILDRMTNFPNLLHRLGESLTKEHNPRLQEHAAFTIANLGWGDGASKNKIINFPRLLDRLVQSIVQDQNIGLQLEATRALRNISGTRDITSLDEMINVSDLLCRLGELLAKKSNPLLQEHAAATIADLGRGDETRKNIVIKFSWLLDRLVQSVAQDENIGLQLEATRAIRNVSGTWDITILAKMASFPDLLHRLGESLAKESNPLLQERAAATIANLGRGRDVAHKKKIADFPGLLQELVQSTVQDQNVGLQGQAARALGYLASALDTTILDSFLRRLGESLMPECTNGIQEQAATVLAYLGCVKEDAIKSKIVSFPKLLENLVHSVARDDNSRLQEQAAHAIRECAATGDTTTLDEMINFPNLLDTLGESLINDGNPALQERAAWALASLTGAEGKPSWHETVNLHVLLDKVVQSMPHSQNQGWFLDQDDARALGNLANVGDSTVKNRMVSASDLLDWLTKSLLRDDNPRLQETATWALGNLASTEDKEVKDKMANFPSLLQNLVRALDEDNNCGLQMQAARALSQLPHAEYSAFNDKIAIFLQAT